MNAENVNLIEVLLFNILSTLNALLAATATTLKDKEASAGLLKQAQDTQNLLININLAKQHKTTTNSCFGCKYFDLNHIATMCRCDLNSNYHKFGCRFKKEEEVSK